MKKFSQSTIEKLKSYVYVLTSKEIDNSETIFYVGKGKGNRVFEHFEENNKINLSNIKSLNLTEKERTLLFKKCNAYIIEGELTDKEAKKIESAIINLLSFFPKANIQNLIKGHNSFGIHDVKTIASKYSQPIDLENFCKKNNIKILSLKLSQEAYSSTVKNDFRGDMEGTWKLDLEKLESVDYVIGVYSSRIIGIYKYIPGSAKNLYQFTQDSWYRWNQIHISMGRILKYANNDKNLKTSDLEKKVFELIPVLVQESQNIRLENDVKEKDKIIGKKLINKNIQDKKIYGRSGMSGRHYFGL